MQWNSYMVGCIHSVQVSSHTYCDKKYNASILNCMLQQLSSVLCVTAACMHVKILVSYFFVSMHVWLENTEVLTAIHGIIQFGCVQEFIFEGQLLLNHDVFCLLTTIRSMVYRRHSVQQTTHVHACTHACTVTVQWTVDSGQYIPYNYMYTSYM